MKHYGTGECPACGQVVPRIWDGTCGSHTEPESVLPCAGSYFAPRLRAVRS